jgi:hypothetical protein
VEWHVSEQLLLRIGDDVAVAHNSTRQVDVVRKLGKAAGATMVVRAPLAPLKHGFTNGAAADESEFTAGRQSILRRGPDHRYR